MDKIGLNWLAVLVLTTFVLAVCFVFFLIRIKMTFGSF
jgi:hypothetical protein